MTGVIIKSIGKIDYQQCWKSMKEFTEQRTSDTLTNYG